MRRLWSMLLLSLAMPVAADDLYLQASGADSTVDSRRVAIARTFRTESGGFEAGIEHFHGGDANWILGHLGFDERPADDVVLRGRFDFGPGAIDGRHILYRKASLGATWIASPAWSFDLSDTYVNVDDSIGHVVGVSASHNVAQTLTFTIDASRSAGGNLDTEQLGLKFRWQAPATVIAGLYGGETRNPVLLNEVGADFGTNSVRLRQAYAGLELPVGRVTVLTLFDYLTLDDVIRRELSIVVRIPFGTGPGVRE